MSFKGRGGWYKRKNNTKNAYWIGGTFEHFAIKVFLQKKIESSIDDIKVLGVRVEVRRWSMSPIAEGSLPWGGGAVLRVQKVEIESLEVLPVIIFVFCLQMQLPHQRD